MSRDELQALAARVEALTGPCRETDSEIAGTESSTVQWHGDDETPAFTASLDAAMSLVGTGPRRIEFGTYGDGSCWAYFYTENDVTGESEGAPNEASAVTAAALRARAAMENSV
jgi:hypothetical protein